MSIIETLTEGMVNRNMETEGAALLNKWTQTGLLEGLSGNKAQMMAVLLENQAKSLLKESNTMSGNSVEGFAAVAFPIVRRVFAGLIANDLVSVQPMSLPSGLIFFLDFTFGSSIGDAFAETAQNRFGNSSAGSLYGTDRVGSEITGGVNLVGSLGENQSGPREAVGYAYASPTGSLSALQASGAAHRASVDQFTISAATDAQKKLLKYDPDLLDLATTQAYVVDIAKSLFTTANADFDNLSAFNILPATLNGLTGLTTAGRIIRRATSLVAAGASSLTSNVAAVRFVIVEGTGTSSTLSFGANIAVEVPVKDSVGEKSGGGGALNAYEMLLEANTDIPEIDIKVDSIAITAQTKKLKAKWTPELGQDLNAYHNIDAEVELTSILSEQIALEIDREILADLVNGATAATLYWSRSPGLFVNRTTGAEIGATSAAPDFTGTVSEWYETLIETVNDVSAQIHRKTLRGGATHVVCSPEVANVLEFTAGFRANVTADADRGDIGAVKVGSLNRKFDIIVDPYFPRNVMLVARIGSSFLESGYVYAPYVPLQTTPTIFGPDDFTPRKGVMTRYAKKMVRPDMYGLVIVRDLLGGEYSS
tara:strand:+ start:85 stop:1866 length:1782 start_codon:yes stop_codon:yes gene_type:complete